LLGVIVSELQIPMLRAFPGLALWLIEPDRTGERGELPWSCMDAEERRRAATIASEQRRRLFVAAHVGLRHILAGYLGIAPHVVRYRSGATAGKPQLHPSLNAALRFNLSHTRGLALAAVAFDREVGIDVEWTGRRLTAPAGQQRELLVRWTRQEAIAKLTGEGLARILAHRQQPDESPEEGFIVLELAPTAEHVGALAVADRP
jgi:4'-phosphopantetheinyl transferase